MSRRIGAVGCLLLVAALVGCAGSATPSASSEVGPSPSPSPTAACPQIEGVDLPPGCAPYDPDAAMAENDRYRERMELSEDAEAVAEELAGPLRVRLEEIRASGSITSEAVEEAIMDAGLPQPQLRAAADDVLFGVAGPDGGCVFGAVTPEAVIVEVGGYIMDGGCLPAQ
ncbi:hypothetical protein [Microbacterium sp. NPDC056234]|uniref:hypothetical protein n=1 Tax=Microbacterium sp. NPDC056234 TaxID=3345757 RepID=UPI0035DD6AC1